MWIKKSTSVVQRLVLVAIVAMPLAFFLRGPARRAPLHAQPREEADLVLLNGKIITVDANDSIAEAVAAKAGVFVKVGTNDEVRAFIGPSTNVLYLNGRAVTPGLIDSHTHLAYYGQVENQFLNLRPPRGHIDCGHRLPAGAANRSAVPGRMGDRRRLFPNQ